MVLEKVVELIVHVDFAIDLFFDIFKWNSTHIMYFVGAGLIILNLQLDDLVADNV